eukprot:jgi/Mesvir1/7943/Mv11863-RA.1
MSSASPKRAVYQLSLAFFLVFLAFGPVQNLESTLNSDAGLGATSLGVLYFSLAFFSLLTARLVSHLGTRATLVGGLSTYSTFVAAHWWPGWTTLIPASALLGFGASLVWVAQGTYLSLAARIHAGLMGVPHADALAQFNGIFWGIFQSTQVFGNAISMVLLRDSGGDGKGAGDAPADITSIDAAVSTLDDRSVTQGGDAVHSGGSSGGGVGGDPRVLISVFLAFSLGGVAVAYLLPSLSNTPSDDPEASLTGTTLAKGVADDDGCEEEAIGGGDPGDDRHEDTHKTPLLSSAGGGGSSGAGRTDLVVEVRGGKEGGAGGGGSSGIPGGVALQPTSHAAGAKGGLGRGGGKCGVLSAAVTDWRSLALLVPIMGYSGAQGAFIWGDFTRDVVAAELGVPWVGGVMAVFGASDAAASFAVGQLRGKGNTSLAASIILAALSQLALLWVIFLRSAGAAGAGHPWQVFLIAALWGCGDAIWNTQLSSLLGGMFVHSTCFLSPHMPLFTRVVVLSVAILLALVCYAPVAMKGCRTGATRHKLKAAQG